jgi:hypothetical protein
MSRRDGVRGETAQPDALPASPSGRAFARRAAALLGALATGVVIGVVVERLAGTAWGFVAVPLALVVGWWRFADPTQCVADTSPPDASRGAGR